MVDLQGIFMMHFRELIGLVPQQASVNWMNKLNEQIKATALVTNTIRNI